MNERLKSNLLVGMSPSFPGVAESSDIAHKHGVVGSITRLSPLIIDKCNVVLSSFPDKFIERYFSLRPDLELLSSFYDVISDNTDSVGARSVVSSIKQVKFKVTAPRLKTEFAKCLQDPLMANCIHSELFLSVGEIEALISARSNVIDGLFKSQLTSMLIFLDRATLTPHELMSLINEWSN